MTLRAGPWINHDGRGYPRALVHAERLRGAVDMEVRRSSRIGFLKATNFEKTTGLVDPGNPGWVWSAWSFLAWRCRVCDDPRYRPILQYRFHYHQPPAVSAQVEMLRAIAAGQRLPDAEPMPGEPVSDAARGGRIPRGSSADFSLGRDAGFHDGGSR